MLNIKLASRKDYKLINDFIKKNWKKNHIFCTNKKILDWQHYNKIKKKYNFVIAKNKKVNRIIAILGFIPTNQFDKKIKINQFIWLAIWKVMDSFKGKKIGTSLLDFLIKKIKPKNICTVGASDLSLNIYKRKKYLIGELNHFYILNPYKKKFKLIKINKIKKHDKKKSKKKIKLLKINNFLKINSKFFQPDKIVPHKTKKYILNRYYFHPIYKYYIFGIFINNKILSIAVTRISQHKNTKVLRIVDFFGSSITLRNLYDEWIKIIKQFNAEYLDLYSAGINSKHIISSGFTKKKDEIIPNYFEPFIKKNVKINFMINSKNKKFRIFRGDSDQDRPNISL